MNLFLTVICVFLLTASPAMAAPLGLGAVFAKVTWGLVAKVAIRLVLTVGISLLSQKAMAKKLRRQQGDQPQRIDTLYTSTGGTDPQRILLGHVATGGHVVYKGSFGNNMMFYNVVIELSDMPIALPSYVYVNGVRTAPEAAGTPEWPEFGQIIKRNAGGQPRAWVRFHDGRQTAADEHMAWRYASAAHPWRGDFVGRGIAYAVVTVWGERAVFDAEPRFLFEVDGAPLYDPRYDSSVGGDGAHRWGQPETYAGTITFNPIVIAYNILRGIQLPCGNVWGGDAEAEDLPLSNWIPAMNRCDEVVDGRFRYTFGYEAIVSQDDPADVVLAAVAAANGQIAEEGGRYYVQVAEPEPPVVHFTDDDILVSAPQDLDPFPALDGVYNAVSVTHRNVSAEWQMSNPLMITNAAFEAEDGQRLTANVELDGVFNTAQAAQIGEAMLADHRRFIRHKLTLPPEYAWLRCLHTVSWTSAANGYAAKLFEITSVAVDPRTMTTLVALRERDPTDTAHRPGVELPDDPGVSTSILRVAATLPGFNVLPLIVENGQTQRPAIRVVWGGEGETLPEASGVSIQARFFGAALPVLAQTSTEVQGGEHILEPVIPATDYEVRGRLVTRDNVFEWTDWISVTSPDVRLSGVDLSDEVRTTLGEVDHIAEDLATLRDGYEGTLPQLQAEYAAAVEAAEAAETALATFNATVAALRPSEFVAAEAWSVGAPVIATVDAAPTINPARIVSDDPVFGAAYTFETGFNEVVGPIAPLPWTADRVYALRVAVRVTADGSLGTGVDPRLGITLFDAGGRDSAASNLQYLAPLQSVADGVVTLEVWATARSGVAAALPSGVDGLITVTSQTNADNIWMMPHVRIDGDDAGAWARVGLFEVRDVTDLADTLIASAASSQAATASQQSATEANTARAGAEVAETQAVSARQTAEGAAATALVHSQTAARVLAQGVVGYPTLQQWSGGNPFGVNMVATAGGSAIQAAGGKYGFCVEMDTGPAPTASSPYLLIASSYAANQAARPAVTSSVRVRLEVSLVSGDWNGFSVLMQWRGTTTVSASVALDDGRLSAEAGLIQTVECLIPRPAAVAAGGNNDLRLFVYATSALGNGRSAKVVRVHSVQFEPVVAESVAAITQAVLARTDGWSSSLLGLSATAGGANAGITVVALDDLQTPISGITFKSDYYTFAGGMALFQDAILQSDNYAEDTQGVPTAGWQLDGATGQIKGKSVVTSELLAPQAAAIAIMGQGTGNSVFVTQTTLATAPVIIPAFSVANLPPGPGGGGTASPVRLTLTAQIALMAAGNRGLTFVVEYSLNSGATWEALSTEPGLGGFVHRVSGDIGLSNHCITLVRFADLFERTEFRVRAYVSDSAGVRVDDAILFIDQFKVQS